MFVPVIDQKQKPLMPTTPSRAAKWIRSGKATPFWKKGIFCVRLNVQPSNFLKQDIAVGIDTGLKREAYTIKSKSHTYLNILSETVYWVQKTILLRKLRRRGRRCRNTPYRKPKLNKKHHNRILPSVKSRWNLKLRISSWICQLFPVNYFIVEDIKAKTREKSLTWNKNFLPLMLGKFWFYKELGKLASVATKSGYETKQLRDDLGLIKSNSKLQDKFECHNIDSWVLANSKTGGHNMPENKQIIKIIPLRFHRRQLHSLQFSTGNIKRQFGGTRSLGFKRGSLIKHKKHNLCYVGGHTKNRISLHNLATGERKSRDAKTADCKFLTYNSWRNYIIHG